MLQVGRSRWGAGERCDKKPDERETATVFEGKLVVVEPAKGALARSAPRRRKCTVAVLCVLRGADMAPDPSSRHQFLNIATAAAPVPCSRIAIRS